MTAASGAPLSFTDDGRGEPLVLLHAFPLDGRMWDRQKRDLAPAWRVIVPDLAGFGRSAAAPPRASLDEHADDVVRLLDALGIERTTLVGLSMGGYVALSFARRHPARLARLGLADTRAAPDTAEGKIARDQSITLVTESGVAPLVERLLPRLLSAGASNDTIAFVRAVGSSQSADAVKAALRAMRDRIDSTFLLAGIAVPSAVIVGEADAITPSPEARAMAAALPDGAIDVIPEAGHLANLEAPEPFTAALRKLLDRPPHR